MKKKLFLLLSLISILLLSGCKKTNEHKDIVVTMFPQYDIVKQIVDDKIGVSLITPIGTEVHGFEPTSKQLITIKNSKLFIFTSYEIDTWVTASLIKDINHLNLYENFSQISYPNTSDVDFSHYWTDPIIFINLIDTILEQLILIDNVNQSFYIKNANDYKNKILSLHNEMANYFKNQKGTIFFAGHNSMLNFSSRYQLKMITLHEHFEPDADLTSQQLKSLVDKIKASDIHFLFIGELVSTKVGESIKTALGTNYPISILELHSYHNITLQDYNQQTSYYDLMLRNFNHLKLALGGLHE
mgnify:CR=1 FL=1